MNLDRAKRDDYNSGATVGGFFGGLAMGLIVGFLLCWVKRKMVKKTDSNERAPEMTMSPLYDHAGCGKGKAPVETVYEEVTGFGPKGGAKEEETTYQTIDSGH